MEIKRFGEQACIISFKEEISKSTHHQVMALLGHFKSQPLVGITDIIPSYNALTIIFDPYRIQFDQLQESILQVDFEKAGPSGKKWKMPVCYDFALDQKDFCQSTGLSWQEVIDLHTSTTYHVYMMGFLPGFLYMGEVDTKIRLPRKKTPRKKVEAGSVGIAGAQTGVYPIMSPGGWNILGRTPVTLFDPTDEKPFPVEIGDEILFYPISQQEFKTILKDKKCRMEESHGS